LRYQRDVGTCTSAAVSSDSAANGEVRNAATVVATRSASAADNPYQRGPDPTVASVAATYGTFATAQINVAPGNGFNGGTIYYPTDTSQGTWGAVAIVPGYTAKFANEEAWMGPRLASFGFVVIGVAALLATASGVNATMFGDANVAVVVKQIEGRAGG